MTKTYRIATPVGTMARWLPSLDIAKERYTQSVLDGWRDHHEEREPMPVVTFEPSIEDEFGQPMGYEYTRCMEDDRWDSSIFIERGEWPSWDMSHGSSPPLAMRRASGPHHCPHEHLICSNSCEPRHGRPEPRIRCASCGATWHPEGP